MNGIINVLKPPMMTSQSVVSAVKKITGEPHVGHTGTLDPNAAGVLPVCLGRSTKLAEYLLADEKEYIGEILFGVATDSFDTEGNITGTSDKIPSYDELAGILPQFIGQTEQVPPAFSAIKIAGKKAYELARENKDVEIPKRTVNIYSIEIVSNPSPERFIIRVLCSKGTYIRSLANDIAEKLGTVGCLSMLVRTRCGVFNINNSVSLDELSAASDGGFLRDIMIDPNSAMSGVPYVIFDEAYEKKLFCGNMLGLSLCSEKSIDISDKTDLLRIICKGELIALGRIVVLSDGTLAVQPSKVIV